MKGLTLKVGIAMMLGVGSLLLAAPAAHAKDCPPYEFLDERDCQAEAKERICQAAAIQQVPTFKCYDTNGDCNVDSDYKREEIAMECAISATTNYRCTSVIYTYRQRCLQV